MAKTGNVRRGRAWTFACVVLVSVLGSSAASAQSGSDSDSKNEVKPMLPKNPQELVAKTFGSSMKLAHATAGAIELVKGAINLDPFAVIDGLISLLAGEDSQPPDITVREARDEILGAMREAREEEFTGRSNALLSRYAEVIADPHNMVANDRIANLVDDAADLFFELQAVLLNTDPKRAQTVYNLAATFNTVANVRIVALSMLGDGSASSRDQVYIDAIRTNQKLVSDEDRYGGLLFPYVMSLFGPYQCSPGLNTIPFSYTMDIETGQWKGVQTLIPGPLHPCDLETEERKRFDSDPMVFLIRANATDQASAVLGSPLGLPI